MKTSKRSTVLAMVVLLANLLRPFCQELHSQATLNALTFGPGINDVGYLGLATGWTFVPTTDLRVLAVGGGLPTQGSSLEVAFWDGTNQIIASYSILVQPPGGNGVLYQPVAGLTLKEGAAYGISTLGADLPVQVFSRQGADGDATYSTSPFISHFGNFEVSTNNVWNPVPSWTDNSDWLYLGATFQFQVLRQLSVYMVSNGLVLSWPTQSVLYAVQQSVDVTTNYWLTLTNAPLIVGSNNQIAIPKPTGTRFFRLISQ